MITFADFGDKELTLIGQIRAGLFDDELREAEAAKAETALVQAALDERMVMLRGMNG